MPTVRNRQSLLVYFSNPSAGAHFNDLPPGFQTESIQVPGKLTAAVGNVRVHLRAAIDYSPTATPTGPRYALIVTSLYFE
jgi:hypothetical protein